MHYNPALLEAAGRYLGVEEWPGSRQNPAVLGFFDRSGHPQIHEDETPWCAAFVGAVLAELGLPNTGRLNARSYLDWGAPVGLADARPGDVVVLWRGQPSGWQGHVGFLVAIDGDKLLLRGGNQGNRVSDHPYPTTRILAIRRAVAGDTSGRPTLRHGSTGAPVRDLQDRLVSLGYPVGAVDGSFGARTRGAVLAFQADHDLTSDGVVGPATRDALDRAARRPERDLDEAALRARGSTTLKNADSAQAGTTLAMVIGSGTLAVERAEGALAALERSGGILDRAGALVSAYWPVLLLLVLGLGTWYLLSEIKRARIEDARSGRNLGR